MKMTDPEQPNLTRELERQQSGAILSDCNRYRYALWRRWSDGSLVGFILLNPATADEIDDDATITRCKGFAERWGYSGIVVCNLFAWRSTDPSVLNEVDDPVGLQRPSCR